MNVYKLVMIISLSVVALMLLIFALLTFQVTVVWIRKRHGQNNNIIWHKNCGVNIKLIAKYYNMYTSIVHIPYSLDQTPLSISRRSRIVAAPPEVPNENSRRSRIVAAPRLLFENTSTWTCLATRFRWQVHEKQSKTSSNLLYISKRARIS